MTGSAPRKPGERPVHVHPPANLAKSPPIPQPDLVEPGPEAGGRGGLDPVRYGDWEIKGIAVDF